MSSLSSQILSSITSFRNPNGTENEWARTGDRASADPLKVALAEVGYVATIPLSIIETALSAIANLFSYCLPIGPEKQEIMSNWLRSSTFSVAWSSVNTVINPFCNDMIVTERVARACAATRNLFEVPPSALESHA